MHTYIYIVLNPSLPKLFKFLPNPVNNKFMGKFTSNKSIRLQICYKRTSHRFFSSVANILGPSLKAPTKSFCSNAKRQPFNFLN